MSAAYLPGHLLTDELPSGMDTGAAQDNTFAFEIAQSNVHRDSWQALLDEKLIEWGRNPQQLEDAELMPPTRSAVNTAVHLACEMGGAGVPPPLRVVPDGDGGIVLERWAGATSATIEVNKDGSAELVRCHDHRVIGRVVLVAVDKP